MFLSNKKLIFTSSNKNKTMQTQPTPPNKINLLEIVDNYIIYSIGSNVYQIGVTQEDLEFVFGVEESVWEDGVSGHTHYDESPVISSLDEVDESDYTLLISSTMSKAEDITDAYEKPINDTEKELMRIVELSNQDSVKEALVKLMIESRLAQQGYSFHLLTPAV